MWNRRRCLLYPRPLPVPSGLPIAQDMCRKHGDRDASLFPGRRLLVDPRGRAMESQEGKRPRVWHQQCETQRLKTQPNQASQASETQNPGPSLGLTPAGSSKLDFAHVAPRFAPPLSPSFHQPNIDHPPAPPQHRPPRRRAPPQSSPPALRPTANFSLQAPHMHAYTCNQKPVDWLLHESRFRPITLQSRNHDNLAEWLRRQT